MTLYRLIGRDWSVADGLTFLGESMAPLRSQVPAIASVLGLTDTSGVYFFQCDPDSSPLAHLDLDKSLAAQQVPANGFIYVGVTAEEDTTPKARRYAAASGPRRNSFDRRDSSSRAADAQQPSPMAAARPHAMTNIVPAHTAAIAAAVAAVDGTAPPAAVRPAQTAASAAHPVKKLRFADEADTMESTRQESEGAVAVAANSPESVHDAFPSAMARSAMKGNTTLSSNASDTGRSPRVHVDPSPPVVIEADPRLEPAQDMPCSAAAAAAAAACGQKHATSCDHVGPHAHPADHPGCTVTSSAVATALADVGCEGLSAETRDAARALLLRLADAILVRRPEDVETCVIDVLCSEQLHSDTVSTNLTASAPSRVDGLPETHEPARDDDDDGAVAATASAGACEEKNSTATPATAASTSSGEGLGLGASPPKEASNTLLTFAPVGDTVAERLAFDSPVGAGRALVMRLAKLVLDVKPTDPEEFLHIRLTSRNFGEEAAMTTLLARTVDPDTLMAAEDPTMASLLRAIPVDSPGFNVVANLLPGLFSRKPENPVNYMFDHLCGRARSSCAPSMRSSMKLPASGAVGSNGGASYVESCTSRDDDDDDDLDEVVADEEVTSESAVTPYPLDGPAGAVRGGRASSNVAHFLHALQRRNSVDKLRASEMDQAEGSPASPVSLHVHPSDSIANARRVSIARGGGEKRAGSTTQITRCGSGYSSSNRRTAGGTSSRSGQEPSLCSTPTAGRQGEADVVYPMTLDRHGSRLSASGGGADVHFAPPPSRGRTGGRPSGTDAGLTLAAVSVLSPSQQQDVIEEYTQQLALLELRVQRMQVELACRRHTREYQERMLSQDAGRDGSATSNNGARRSGSLKAASAAERETARYVEALQAQQETLMALVEVMRSSGAARSAVCPSPPRADMPATSGGSWARFSPAPQDEEVTRRLEWMALEQQHMRSMMESLFVRNPSLGRL